MKDSKRTITIDGSYGEGGGQILRTACALSAVAGIPCHITNIRKSRRNPGLKLQHLVGIRSLGDLCNGKIVGDSLQSEEIYFYPGEVRPTTLNLRIETAGSITLVLQTLLLPSFFAKGPVRINIQGGGTDTAFAPTIDYHRFVFLELLAKLGLRANVVIIKRGFYPKGDAMVKIEVIPGKPKSWVCSERGDLDKISIISGASESLKGGRVSERQAKAAEDLIVSKLKTKTERRIEYYSTLSPGSQINIIGKYKNTFIGIDGIGERGKRAENVGQEAALRFVREHDSGACIDQLAGDQILPYLSLAEGTSTVTLSHLSEHAKTNLWVIEKFLERSFKISKDKSKAITSIN